MSKPVLMYEVQLVLISSRLTVTGLCIFQRKNLYSDWMASFSNVRIFCVRILAGQSCILLLLVKLYNHFYRFTFRNPDTSPSQANGDWRVRRPSASVAHAPPTRGYLCRRATGGYEREDTIRAEHHGYVQESRLVWPVLEKGLQFWHGFLVW